MSQEIKGRDNKIRDNKTIDRIITGSKTQESKIMINSLQERKRAQGKIKGLAPIIIITEIEYYNEWYLSIK